MTILDEIKAHFGSGADVSRALGLERGTFFTWEKFGIPVKRALQIEAVTMGKFKAADIYTYNLTITRKRSDGC